MDTFGIELRAALRSVRAQPTNSALAIGVLAMGLGAALLVGAAADSLLLRPLPYPDADRLIALRGSRPAGESGISLLDFRDLRSGLSSLQEAAAFRRRSFLLETPDGSGASRVVQAAQATAGVPATFGFPPRSGRDFTLAEERDGSAVALVSARTVEALGMAADEAVSSTVLLNDVSYRIVGVLDPAFELWVDGEVVELIVPLDPALYGVARTTRSLIGVARLADATELRAAQSAIDGLAARLARDHPDTNEQQGFAAQPLSAFLRGANRGPVEMLSIAGLLLLVGAAANFAALFLERVMATGPELGVRLCLGARAGRLTLRLAAEAGLLATAGLLTGWVIASAGLALLPTLLTTLGGDPGILALTGLAPGLGMKILGAGLATVSILALALGGGLGWLLRRGDLARLIRTGPDTAVAVRGRRALVAGQVGLSVVLLLAAGLLSLSFVRLVDRDPGFRVDEVVRFGIGIPVARYELEAAQIDLHRRLEARLLALPGVKVTGLVASLPLGGRGFETWYEPAAGSESGSDRTTVSINVASPGYFEALTIPLVRGRTPRWDDGPEAPRVAVIDETLAAAWGGTDPVGERIRVGWFSAINPAGTEWEIVGVVGAVRRTLGEVPRPTVYLGAAQFPLDGGNYVLRTEPGSMPGTPEIRGAIAEVDPGLQRVDPTPLSERLRASVGAERTAAVLATGFASSALVLTLVAIYGLVAVDAARRRRELAIRSALGATRGALARWLAVGATRTVAAGITLGVLGYLPVSGLLHGRLHDVARIDAWVVTVVLTGLAAGGMMAALIPALRATAVARPAHLHDE